MRWYQLDPQQWSSGSTGSANGTGSRNNRGGNIPSVPSFKIYATRTTSVSPAVATFEALNRRAASSVPTYLTRPVFLPSTVDDDDDEEEETKSSIIPPINTHNHVDSNIMNTNNSNHSSNNRRGIISTEESDDDTINTVNSSACVSQISVQFEEQNLDGLD